jgi:hypothetical protein
MLISPCPTDIVLSSVNDHPHHLNMSNVLSSTKLPPSSKASAFQKSWAQRYKEQLLEHKKEWLNMDTKKEEDAVIEATLMAIEGPQ